MSNQNDPGIIYDLVAVQNGHHILVFGGRAKYTWPSSFHVIWLYNLYTEQWQKYVILQSPSRQTAPTGRIDMCTVVIRKDIYMFGGLIYLREDNISCSISSEVWKLTKAENRSLQWKKVGTRPVQKTPSPRFKHTAWNYADKLWVFGGFGNHTPEHIGEHGDFMQNQHTLKITKYNVVCYLYTYNQLLCFDPTNEVWTNPECCGMIPSCRGEHSTTIIGDQVWLYGGKLTAATAPFDDLYKLNMLTLTWTHIQTDQNRPQVFRNYTLNAITESHIVLQGHHASGSNDTWILDMPTLSWKKHSSDESQLYSCQNACLGINSNIVMVGGINNSTCIPPPYTAFHVMLAFVR